MLGLSIDPLEDRRLLSATTVSNESPAIVAAPLGTVGAQVVGRSIFYNNSRFDGYSPAANPADDDALAVDKQALLSGQLATLTNYTSYSGGINGILIDVAGLAGTPTAEDFLFRMGNTNDPGHWIAAPTPTSISVRPGAGGGGASRITLIWADGTIKNTWLQITLQATANSGLNLPEVFYFGNAVGESGNSATDARVTSIDQLATRNSPFGIATPAPITIRTDYNRDGLVNSTDELIARGAVAPGGPLQLIAPSFQWSQIVGRHTFYNNSKFDGRNPSADAADDAAIATDKQALLPGGAATFSNYTSYSRGLNGIMIDMAGLTHLPSADDFEFRVGNNNAPQSWAKAPAPSSISVRLGAGVGGSARVTLLWPDFAIRSQWLQVTVKATANTQLTRPDIFYFGNAPADTGDSPLATHLTASDLVRLRNAYGNGPAPITSPFDFNRDGWVSATDEVFLRKLIGSGSPVVQFIRPTMPATPLVTVSGEKIYADFVAASVVARNIFYNNSQFDVNDPRATATDDQAIATDKQALLPGGAVTFANYTSYSRGINGVMIDVAGLPDLPTVDDFDFRVANSGDGNGWTAAPRPLSISARQGAGVGGSARITIVWADRVIRNTWLQITLKATTRTGLSAGDVFYFGNLVGDSGNSATVAAVTTVDQTAVRNHLAGLTNPVGITSAYDYNRNGLVDSSDEWIALNNIGHRLALPASPADFVAANGGAPRPQLDLFNEGDGGFQAFFAPNLTQAPDGSLLAIAEGRSSADDPTSHALTMRRSIDNGATWSAVSTIYGINPASSDRIGSPSIVLDKVSGELFLLFTRNNSSVLVTRSRDNGLNWSTPVDVTDSVKVTDGNNPNPGAFPSAPWKWYATGPTHGIQIQHGPYAGRLVIVADHRLTADTSGISWTHVIYSDDHGLTWHLGGGLDQNNPQNDYSNEASLVEQSDGALYMTIRINNGSPIRGSSRSFDGGLTWTDMVRENALTTFSVSASILRVDDHTVLLAAPDTDNGVRSKITIWASFDDMVTWTKTKTIYYGNASYSDMTLIGPGTVLLAYDRGHGEGSPIEHIGLTRFNLHWLLDSVPDQFRWDFNEQPPGQAANIAGPTLIDLSPWGNVAQAKSDSVANAPRYVAGRAGNDDSALRLTKGPDLVQLTPASSDALRFGANDSFTIEVVLRTIDTNGVVLGTRLGIPNLTLQIVDGFGQFSVNDGVNSALVKTDSRINDGNWHSIVIIRERAVRTLWMYVDGARTRLAAYDSTENLQANEAVTLGAYNTGSGQLAFDVDSLRVTRGALAPAQFMPLDSVAAPRFAPAPFRSGAPNTIPDLRFWLTGYDPARYFADINFSQPLPIVPPIGSAVESAWDASSAGWQVSMPGPTRQALYAKDSVVGSSWLHAGISADAGTPWIVRNSNGTSANNFDFVQNSGVFTLSTFLKRSDGFSATMALFDTADATANAGFSLLLQPSGSVTLLVVGADNSTRFLETSPAVIAKNSWYHVAVVGNGPGNPITFYITPASAQQVAAITSRTTISGINGDYPTDANQDLSIGSLALSGHSSFNGQMVDQAIYDRALSTAEIQQLFNYTKSGATG